MKQKLSPATVIAIVVVVVIVVAAIGYFAFLKPKANDGGPAESEMGPEAMKQQMDSPEVRKMQQEQEAGAGGGGQYRFR